jgi:hypothetical protein
LTRIGVLTPEQLARVWKATLDSEISRSGKVDEREIQEAEPILYRNDSGHTVPPYGIVQVSGCIDVENSYNYLTAKRAFDYAANQSIVLVNGPREVEDGDYGTAQPGPVFRVVHDGAITYAVGDRVGWKANSFQVALGPLFRVVGEDDIVDNCLRVVFDQSPCMGESIATIAAGSSGLVRMRKPASGGWTTDTAKSYVAFNDTPSDITGNKRLKLFPIDGRFAAVEVC